MVNLTYQSFLHKEISKEENKITKKQFAMFIQDDNKYVEYKGDNLFPKDYYVNKSLSKCVDENDNPVEDAINSIGNSVTITSNKTIYCTLYFDKNEILEFLRSKDTNNSLSEDIVGDMYRYQGVAEEYASDGLKVVDNNYICLGSDCTEEGEDLYRIIGVTETGELKVITENIYENDSNWNNNLILDTKWPNSVIYHNLNDDTDSFYNSLDNKLKNNIKNFDWIYGDTLSIQYNGIEMYKIESGNKETIRGIKNANGEYEEEKYFWNKEKDVIEAPIGLMYSHDYLLAYNSSTNAKEDYLKSWIHFSKNDSDSTKSRIGLITRRGYVSNNYYYYWSATTLEGIDDSLIDANHRVIRPVFYLTSDILITGEGTLTEPFKLSQN